MKNSTYTSSFSLFSGLEKACVQGLDLLSSVSISAIDHTHEVIDHAEKLANRLLILKKRADKMTSEQQTVLKQQLLSLCHDTVDVGTESVQGVFKLLQLTLSEAKEVQQQGDKVWKDVRPELNLNNPFRSPKTVKPSTIIPISIQDN